MAQIELTRKHHVGLETAREIVNDIAQELADEHGVSTFWNGNTLQIHRTGLKGSIHVSDDQIRVDARLGLSMLLFKHTLEKELELLLDEHF